MKMDTLLRNKGVRFLRRALDVFSVSLREVSWKLEGSISCVLCMVDS